MRYISKKHVLRIFAVSKVLCSFPLFTFATVLLIAFDVMVTDYFGKQEAENTKASRTPEHCHYNLVGIFHLELTSVE
ncbi:hypothetical protein A4A49_06989 [Nicotiana attenuata]|uniref:Uncharacterized protein n=1 Tax=Nicotiana attenuata TaxID=49451 RepID=A0A314LFD7_NICAT|nr:hypothetical protein A4A49_06989 [Nicotiana attenuata]